MFGVKKGAVAPAPVLGPKQGKSNTMGKSSGASKLGEAGKPASAAGKKAK